MSLQKTFAIIKPDATQSGHIGSILNAIEENGFRIIAMKLIQMTRSQAEGFYYVHKERPFFNDLVAFMTEAPVVALILQKENAIAAWRELMGATNPANAEEGTLRKRFGSGIERNAVHGSDAEETAAYETAYFFNAFERVN
jgi:nucleoside-diphosphate kinase